LRQLLGAGAFAAGGFDLVRAQVSPVLASAPEPFRFAFVTDLHLMKDEALRSAEGIAACLGAVEKLNPRPDFILCGGDLVHLAREMTIAEAEQQLNLFLKIWNNSTALPVRWVFGNHDLVGTSNPEVSPSSPHYGKGLFRDRLGLPHLYYSFEHRGWKFIILDDISPQPDQTYVGQIFEDELAFTRAEFSAAAAVPTIVSTHIPLFSNLPLGLELLHPDQPKPTNLVCTNTGALTEMFPGHDVRAVLCGHLHHYESLKIGGIPFVNSGAVCGSYWKGPMMGCPEGFGVVDVAANGAVKFDYRAYGWKAA
jgi:predicted phosphodiesterase